MSHSLTDSQMATAAQGGPGQNQALHLGLLCGRQGLRSVGHLLLPPRYVSRELNQKWNRRDSNQSSQGMPVLQGQLNPLHLRWPLNTSHPRNHFTLIFILNYNSELIE